jgi:hypothetical protein
LNFALGRYEDAAHGLVRAAHLGAIGDDQVPDLSALYPDPENFEKALDRLERAVAKDPRAAAPRLVRAWILWVLGDVDAARADLHRLRLIRPGDEAVTLLLLKLR